MKIALRWRVIGMAVVAAIVAAALWYAGSDLWAWVLGLGGAASAAEGAREALPAREPVDEIEADTDVAEEVGRAASELEGAGDEHTEDDIAEFADDLREARNADDS